MLSVKKVYAFLLFLQSMYEQYFEENFSDSRPALQLCCQINQILLIYSVRLKKLYISQAPTQIR